MTRPAIAASALLAAGLAAALACSADSGTKSTASRNAPTLALAIEASGDRTVVATVNGVPIYDDCVKRQGEAHELSRKAALEECVDFELLSQAAKRSDLVALPEVQERAKEELVRAYLDASYPYSAAAKLPDALVRSLWQQISPSRYNYPEVRDIVFCRISLSKGATPQGEESKNASSYLSKVYEGLKDRKGLAQDDLFEACYGPIELPEGEARPYTKAGIEELKLRTFRPTPRADFQEDFRAAVFDGPEEVGMVLPPILSPFGWDLILLTQILPAKTTAFEDAEAELRRALFEEPVYEPQREALFQKWYAPLEQKHKVVRSYQALPETVAAMGGQPSLAPDTGGQP